MSLHLFLSSPPLFLPSLKPTKFPKYPFPLNHRQQLSLRRTGHLSATTPTFPNPADDDPPEAPEDTAHGVSKFQQIKRQASRARKLEEDDFNANQSVYLNAIRDVEDAPDNALDDNDFSARSSGTSNDFFADVDKAVSLKRKEFVDKGLLEPNPPKKKDDDDYIVALDDELDVDEVVDLEEIEELRGLRIVDEGKDDDGNEVSFDYVDEFDKFGNSSNSVRIVEPEFSMTLAELLDECKVVPVSVYGDLEVEISGIEHDSRLVKAGDLFVCCVGSKTDGHLFLSEADKRGAVAVVASKEIDIEETLGCKGLVLVEDTNAALPALAAAFYRYPTRDLSVIGVTGTHGKTTTGFLIKGMYEAMGLRTGLMSSVAYYLHGDNKLDLPESSPDGVLVQKLMAKMVHNGAEAVVMEASSNELALGRCEEVDFDIAVFTNLSKDHSGFEGSEEEYKVAQGKLFSKMVDADRHRKIVNIDDLNAPFFIAQGNPKVPVLTYALENKSADVHPLKYELSLFETTVLVNTPQGILEISSGLLGKHNIYNILAAVSVGIAVGAPLEDIVRGIEEIDGVPGRCELIDEEQAFGVIVDHARTPDGLSRLLDSVRELNPRRIITVIGSPGEQERGKRPLLAKIATDKSDVTMLTSDNPRNEDPLDILDDMLAGIGWTMQDYLKHGENDYYPPLSNGHRLFLHDIRRVAVRCAVAMGEEGDVVVVAGKGHEAFQIEGDKTEFFDDREECREALQYVDELHQAGIDTSEFPWRLPESH